MSTENNVVNFPKRPTAIFSDAQREQMVSSINDLSPKPEDVINRIEDALCVQAVAGVRSFADKASKGIADRLANWIFG